MKRILFLLSVILISPAILAQGVLSVSPTSASVGNTGIQITITLDATVAPPSGVSPLGVTIGPYVGTNVTRDNSTVYATFSFLLENPGIYSVYVTFPGPGGTHVYFGWPSQFTVTTTTPAINWNIAGTQVTNCYDTVQTITCPTDSAALFFGQTNGTTPAYLDNGDSTITDLVTGLMWQKNPGAKKSYHDAVVGASACTLGGYSDWRMPTIKELYSLISFKGEDPSGIQNGIPLSELTPFIDTNYFVFNYGDTTAGERIIDAQYWTVTEYVTTVMGSDHSIFGVNFADGRIKSYGPLMNNTDKTLFTQYVRSVPGYGRNNFHDNGDSTVTDQATGLIWARYDAGTTMNWEQALAWMQEQNSTHRYGYSNWRLPTVKELESMVDYTRSPATTSSAAIDPIFSCTPITNEAGQTDYACYWSSSTHYNHARMARFGCYVAFGRAMGYFNNVWQDVHGAGAQRSDPKQGDPSWYPHGNGPQGDAIRINNEVRLVRESLPTGINKFTPADPRLRIYPNPATDQVTLLFHLERNSVVQTEWLNTTGETVLTSDFGNLFSGDHTQIISINLPAGIYFVRLFVNGKVNLGRVLVGR